MKINRILQGQLAVARTESYPDRPTIVFLHDSLGSIQLWRDFPEKLGELTRCNIMVYDRHGYGQSGPFRNQERKINYLETEADILAAVLKECKINQAFLFGHSDGGSIALLAAAKYPDKISAIITEGAHIFVEEETLAGIREAVTIYQSTDLRTKLEKYHGDKTEALFWAWANTWTSHEFRPWNIEMFLPSVTCPALIIQGDKDEYGTSKQVDGIINNIASTATKLLLPNIKHTPHKEAPELVLSHTSRFILNLASQ